MTDPADPADTAAGPSIDPAGFARLVDMAGGDTEFVAELIDTYLEDGERQLAEVKAAIAAGSAADAVRPAHSLKTGSANVGATQVATLCATLEADARAGSLAGADARLASIRSWFERGRAELMILRDGG